MNTLNEMDQFARLQRLINIFQEINQISWTANQTRKRYPEPDTMTPDEIDKLTQILIALGIGLEKITENWKKEYSDYKKGEE